jgi:hypothetical protein
MKLRISSYTYTWNVGVPGFEPPSPRKEQELVGMAASAGIPGLDPGEQCGPESEKYYSQAIRNL